MQCPGWLRTAPAPKGTQADLPWETSTVFLALVEKQALHSSCQLLLFHREPDFPKSVFCSGLIFCGRTGCDVCAGARVPLRSQRRTKGPVTTPYARPTPSPSQGRVWGPTGQAAHIPPRCDARSAGNSPEPSGPPSARRRTERKPRGTVNSTAPPTAAPPCSPALCPHLPQGTYGAYGLNLCLMQGFCTVLVCRAQSFAP